MQNSLLMSVGAVFLAVILGCGISDRVHKEIEGTNTANVNANANKSITDRALETAVGEGKVGIPECDEAIDILATQANSPDDNFVIKAGKKTVLTKFKQQVKKSLENNKANRADVAKYCRDFKSSLATSENPASENKE